MCAYRPAGRARLGVGGREGEGGAALGAFSDVSSPRSGDRALVVALRRPSISALPAPAHSPHDFCPNDPQSEKSNYLCGCCCVAALRALRWRGARPASPAPPRARPERGSDLARGFKFDLAPRGGSARPCRNAGITAYFARYRRLLSCALHLGGEGRRYRLGMLD